MKVLRTPEAAFAGLSDFPFAPHYAEVRDDKTGTPLRIHYIDEGPRDAPVVLMMHGEPTWCYLYRHMITPVVAAGFRVVAPDLVGFGKSDKPAAKTDYSYARHVAWMKQWLEALDLKDMTLACQDWGSLIGLRMAAAAPQRFDRVVGVLKLFVLHLQLDLVHLKFMHQLRGVPLGRRHNGPLLIEARLGALAHLLDVHLADGPGRLVAHEALDVGPPDQGNEVAELLASPAAELGLGQHGCYQCRVIALGSQAADQLDHIGLGLEWANLSQERLTLRG